MNENTIEISIAEYTRLKDIETRFEIMRGQMLHADYCPIHHQIILGIENEYQKKEVNTDLFDAAMKKKNILEDDLK